LTHCGSMNVLVQHSTRASDGADQTRQYPMMSESRIGVCHEKKSCACPCYSNDDDCNIVGAI
jgi:hypothetical protein